MTIRGLGKFTALLRRYETPITDTVVGATALLGVVAAISSASAQPTSSPVSLNHTTSQVQHQQHLLPAKPLTVESVTPGGGAGGVNGTGDIKLTFNAPLSPKTKLPAVSPNIAGSWKVSGDTATFTPQVGFSPDTRVTVTAPAGMQGYPGVLRPTSTLKKNYSSSFTTGGYSTARLQQLLAQLGYLPLTFHPSDSSGNVPSDDPKAQLSAAYDAPSGSLSWEGKYPAQLEDQWRGGENNMLDVGAVRNFEYDHGLTMDGDAGPEVWSTLLSAVAKGDKNQHGYSYALATQGGSGENLQVYRNGKEILYTAANTGVAGAPTADGTFPVFDRTPFQMMKGKNPDGTKYNDPVHWISYFNGGDAIHGFDRAGYGYYQSNGCVEIPVSTSQWLYPYINYGTLVTVQGPEA